MLVKTILEKKIEVALRQAMADAFKAALDATDGADDKTSYTKDDLVNAFADKAKTCAGDIASAIDEYIKSAQITMNMGTLIVPMPGLVSPTGPVTGVITLAAPTVLMNSIS